MDLRKLYASSLLDNEPKMLQTRRGLNNKEQEGVAGKCRWARTKMKKV